MLALLRFLWFPATVVLLVLAWIWLDSALGWRGIQLPALGWALIAVGALLAGWCTAVFHSLGKGTPHPFAAKTKRLVIAGPYRCVRNPMMWGVGAILVGLALLLGSVGLWIGFAVFLIYINIFLRVYEEPDMERRFGDEYREYRRQVPRWWPRFRPK
jgi:protein-S-isoprenylcysteine O-methyltransferase Ste14